MKDENNEMNDSKGNNQQKELKDMGHHGVYISKKSLWLMAGGALGALAAIGIGKASKKIKPALVGAVKEGYAFKEWAAGKIETVKEDIEDIVAEAKHAYYKDIEATEEAIQKEKEILQRLEKEVGKKTVKKKAKKEE